MVAFRQGRGPAGRRLRTRGARRGLSGPAGPGRGAPGSGERAGRGRTPATRTGPPGDRHTGAAAPFATRRGSRPCLEHRAWSGPSGRGEPRGAQRRRHLTAGRGAHAPTRKSPLGISAHGGGSRLHARRRAPTSGRERPLSPALRSGALPRRKAPPRRGPCPVGVPRPDVHRAALLRSRAASQDHWRGRRDALSVTSGKMLSGIDEHRARARVSAGALSAPWRRGPGSRALGSRAVCDMCAGRRCAARATDVGLVVQPAGHTGGRDREGRCRSG
jgi:hypothetical protein